MTSFAAQLTQFATERVSARKPKCVVCTLALKRRQEVEELRASDPKTYSHQTIADFLVKIGVKASRQQVREHFVRHIHAEG